MFAKKFCAASLSFLALSFSCAPKTNAAVSGIGVFNIIAGSLGCLVSVSSIVLGSILMEGEEANNATKKEGLRTILLGAIPLLPSIACILNGVTANDTKQNSVDIKELNERLDKLENKSVG